MKDEELSVRLREAAEAHRPERERMLARVERGMAGGRPPARVVRPPRGAAPWLRIAGATAAVCGVLAFGALAVTSAGGDDGPHGERVAAPPASSPPRPRRRPPASGRCVPRTGHCGRTVPSTRTPTRTGRRAM